AVRPFSTGGLSRRGALSASEQAQLARYQELVESGSELGPRQAQWYQALLGRQALGVEGALAQGGPVAAGHRYLIGERGPEVFVPYQSGYVHPQFQLAGSSLSTFHYSGRAIERLHGSSARQDELEEALYTHLGISPGPAFTTAHIEAARGYLESP